MEGMIRIANQLGNLKEMKNRPGNEILSLLEEYLELLESLPSTSKLGQDEFEVCIIVMEIFRKYIKTETQQK